MTRFNRDSSSGHGFHGFHSNKLPEGAVKSLAACSTLAVRQLQGAAPPVTSWFKIPLTIDISTISPSF